MVDPLHDYIFCRLIRIEKILFIMMIILSIFASISSNKPRVKLNLFIWIDFRNNGRTQ